MGKDPDVAEDFAGSDLSVEKILRQRQRMEICGALKSSNTYYWTYMLKNLFQILATAAFLVTDVSYIMGSSDGLGFCDIEMGTRNENVVTMQCRQKRYDINQTLMIIFSAFLGLTMLLDALALLWWWEGSGMRSITRILKKLKGRNSEDLVIAKGNDFLFLFDMIAHNCGVPATLRVLTYTAPKFTEFCQPKLLIDSLKMDESSLSISWEPPPLQEIEESSVKHIKLQKYVATILPKIKDNFHDIQPGANNTASFSELEGGTKEYIVTVSAIIGDSKMKGATYRTCLPPHPPQNLRIGQDSSKEEGDTNSKLRLSWIKPKGKFDKFLLLVENISVQKTPGLADFEQENVNQKIEVYIDIEQSEYIVQNLNPGDVYKVKLMTMSGNISCLEPPNEKVITKPKPPALENIKIHQKGEEVSVYWQPPSNGKGLSTLEGYEILLRNSAGNELHKVPLSANTYRHVFDSIAPCQEYSIGLSTICRLRDTDNKILITENSNQMWKKFMSFPSPPSNLTLDKSEPTSLKLHWDYKDVGTMETLFPMTISLLDSNEEHYRSEKKSEINKSTIKLTGLPYAGALYEVELKSMIVYNSEPLYSPQVKGLFVTRPCPPCDLQVADMDKQIFQWKKSPTKSVVKYKFKISGSDRPTKDSFVDNIESDVIAFTLEDDLDEDVEYNINISSLAYVNETWHESNSLHHKVKKEIADTSFSSTIDEQDEFDGRTKPRQKLVIIDPKANLEKAGDRGSLPGKVVDSSNEILRKKSRKMSKKIK